MILYSLSQNVLHNGAANWTTFWKTIQNNILNEHVVQAIVEFNCLHTHTQASLNRDFTISQNILNFQNNFYNKYA